MKWDQCADVCAQIGMGASFGCIEDATQNAEAYAALVSGGEDDARRTRVRRAPAAPSRLF